MDRIMDNLETHCEHFQTFTKIWMLLVRVDHETLHLFHLQKQKPRQAIWVCLKIVYPYTQWFCWSLSLLNGYNWGYTPFQTYPYHVFFSMENRTSHLSGIVVLSCWPVAGRWPVVGRRAVSRWAGGRWPVSRWAGGRWPVSRWAGGRWAGEPVAGGRRPVSRWPVAGGRWAGEQVSRWAGEQVAGEAVSRWAGEQVSRWAGEQVGRWAGEQVAVVGGCTMVAGGQWAGEPVGQYRSVSRWAVSQWAGCWRVAGGGGWWRSVGVAGEPMSQWTGGRWPVVISQLRWSSVRRL